MVPNERLPDVFMAVTHDFFGLGANVHELDKRRVALRLMYGSAHMAYGIKKFPLNGPYPTKLEKVVSSQGTLRVHYNIPFTYNKNTSNSGTEGRE